MQQESITRTIIEKAIAYGRMRKSPQSGFIHYHNGTSEEGQHLTIPLHENLLYVLALLRSRTVENINEAKDLLQKLLHFQTEEGAFPIYIHEFPFAKDRYLSVPISVVICYILRDYGHVLGEVRDRLKTSLKNLMQFITSLENPSNKWALPIATVHIAAGKILDDAKMQSKGESLIEALDKTINASWCTPKILGQHLCSLALVYPSISKSPWKDLWDFVTISYHPKTGAYVGPPLCEWQVHEEPQVTLFDYFMAEVTGSLPKRCLKDGHPQLEAVVAHPTEDLIEVKAGEWKGILKGTPWSVCKRDDFAYSAFHGKPQDVLANQEKGFYNFFMIWGDLDRTHSLGCQRVRPGDVELFPIDFGAEIVFSFEKEEIEEDKERNREIVVVIDRSQESSFSVNGEYSNVVHVGDKLTVDGCVNMSFTLVEGEGKFLGHRMPGNRSSQTSNGPFDAYDWLMFLRTIHREGPCKIALRIEKVC